ncbi:MAG: threonylcarbamoyl-AMP synthase [Deltaproteobacteria bacterium]|nr:threonylcarbamoyl-AMP synthase [Deltaproteobacteria bacterium]
MPERKRPLILRPEENLDEAVRIFRSGGVIAFPTETFYGLGVDPFNVKAIERLFALKGRPEKKPVSVIIKDTGMLKEAASEVPEAALPIIKRFWPGPLTIVFKARPSIPRILTANTGRIGVRVSGSPDCQRLLDAIDSPITATSANPSGKKPPVTAAEVLAYFNGDLDVLIDGGELKGKTGSTVIDITGAEIKVIREGEIPASEITGCLSAKVRLKKSRYINKEDCS